MKKITFLFSLLISITTLAQGNGDIVVFSATGEPVYVTLNGIRQNYQPETNLRLQNVMANWYKCKIESYNNSFVIDKNILVKKDTLITYQIKEKNGKYVMHFYTEVPLKAASEQADQQIVTYHQTEQVPEVQQVSTTQTTITNTQVQQDVSGGSVNMNVLAGDQGIGTGISVSDPVTGESVNVNVSIQTSGMSTDQQVNVNETTNYTYSETTTITTTQANSTTQTARVNQVQNNTACLVDNTSMEKLKMAAEKESFSENKMRVVKQFVRNKCLTVMQIEEIVRLFTFSGDMLEVAKFAYDYCLNKGDYFELMDAFTFSADKEELDEFINSKQ